MNPVSTMSEAYCEVANWADDVIIDAAFEKHAHKACSDLFVAFPGLCLGFDDETLEQCGHDLWLTRQGHGAGFWDRSAETYGNAENRQKLTEYAEKVGEFYNYEVDASISYN